MSEQLKFSVAMSVYINDKGSYFNQAITSIIEQTVSPSEIVVVLDGPVKEDIIYILESKKKEVKGRIEIKIIELKKNVGLGKALNIAILNCSYEYIARMDSDDISVKDRFEKQLLCFEKMKGISLVGGYIYEFLDVPKQIVGIRTVPEKDEQIKEYSRKRAPVNHVTVMFKKADVIAAGNYRDWYCNEDYFLWLRMIEKEQKFYNIPENLVYVRVGKDMYNRRGGKRYFISEIKLQRYMLNKKMITRTRYIKNIFLRLVLQILLPSNIRGIVFQKFARRKLV